MRLTQYRHSQQTIKRKKAYIYESVANQENEEQEEKDKESQDENDNDAVEEEANKRGRSKGRNNKDEEDDVMRREAILVHAQPWANQEHRGTGGSKQIAGQAHARPVPVRTSRARDSSHREIAN